MQRETDEKKDLNEISHMWHSPRKPSCLMKSRTEAQLTLETRLIGTVQTIQYVASPQTSRIIRSRPVCSSPNHDALNHAIIPPVFFSIPVPVVIPTFPSILYAPASTLARPHLSLKINKSRSHPPLKKKIPLAHLPSNFASLPCASSRHRHTSFPNLT